jgi:hypothetical protein
MDQPTALVVVAVITGVFGVATAIAVKKGGESPKIPSVVQTVNVYSAPAIVAPAPDPKRAAAQDPVATKPPVAKKTSPTPPDGKEINAVLRARNLLSVGDTGAARAALGYAGASDDAQAALSLGGTYDPIVLDRLRIVTFDCDVARARVWYQKAVTLGSDEAAARLDRLTDKECAMSQLRSALATAFRSSHP